MRVIEAVGMAVTMLVIGFFALSEAAQQTKDAAVTNGTNSTSTAWNASTEIFGGLGEAAGPAVVFMGVAAIIAVALGFLVIAGRSGR